MQQFDVFENPSRTSRSVFPYVVLLQSDVSIGRTTAIVAPVAKAVTKADDRVAFGVTIAGTPHTLMLQGLAAIPKRSLKTSVTNLPELRERLPAAVDYLFLGL